MLSYYKKVLGVKEEDLIPVYKYTKFLSVEQINGGFLTDEEKKSLKNTGYKLNLKNTNLAVLDIDLKNDSDFIELNYEKYNLNELKECDYYKITSYGFNDKMTTNNKFLIYYTMLFDTIFVKTPNNGFHFYFINDFEIDDFMEVFACINYKYIKCNEDDIDVDFFVGDKVNDNYITLPFTNIITDKIDSNGKNIFSEYSSFCYTKNNKLKKLSEIKPLLSKFIKKQEYVTMEVEYTSSGPRPGYSRRALAIKDEVSKLNLLENMRSLYTAIEQSVKEQKGFTSKINTFQLISSIVFLPDDMILPVFDIFLDVFTKNNKLSKNSLKEIPQMFRRLYQKDNIRLWNPGYLKKMIEIKYHKDIDLKPVYFVYDTKESIEKNFGEDYQIDRAKVDINEILMKLNEKYNDLGK